MIKRAKTFRRLSLLLVLSLLGIAAVRVSLTVRKESLNRTLVAVIKTRNRAATVTDLLSKGADPNTRDLPIDRRSPWKQLWDRVLGRTLPTPHQSTVLEVALACPSNHNWSNEDFSVVKTLLDAGAKVDAADENGQTPLIFAAKVSPLENVKLLLERGAHINAQENRGMTALHYAVVGDDPDLVRLLLSKGALVNVGDQDQETPLDAAVRYGKIDIARLLLANGSEVDSRNADGYTPLALAVCANELRAVKLLLAHGAQVDVVNKAGQTPLQLAQSFHYTQMVRLLERAGATK